MDTLVLHDEDFDGWGARYAAWKHFGDEASYTAIDHGKYQEQVPWHLIPEEPTKLYLLDYSWPLDQLFELAETHILTVIDHHESFLKRIKEHNYAAVPSIDNKLEGTAFQGDIGRLSTGNSFLFDPGCEFRLCFDEQRAATILAWRYFHQSEAPKLLKHIEDRDLWTWEMEHTDEVLLALGAEEQSVETYDRFARQPERLIPAGTAIVNFRDKMVSDLVEDATVRDVEIEGETYTLSIVNSPILRSKIGEKVRESHPEVDIVLVFSASDLAEGARVKVSLRAGNEGPSVGQIATALGGGGHDNAAGFGTSIEALSLEDPAQQLVLLN